jgi:single-stranded-DNA-specific exonuclease
MTHQATVQTRLAPRPVDREVHERARAEGFSDLQAAILAGRMESAIVQTAGSVRNAVMPSIRQLDHPDTLPDIDRAVARLVQAVETGETIAVCSDFDADGLSAAVVVSHSLIDVCNVPADQVEVVPTERMIDGYGLTDGYVDRLLQRAQPPTLLVTVDLGSSDAPRIARLRDIGCDCIVTDHHAIPEEGPPAKAVACVNPARADSEFPDTAIAGCHVAWLVMCALRTALEDRDWPVEPQSRMAETLDAVGTGTQADAVSLGTSINNRALVRAALERINRSSEPAWMALKEIASPDGAPWDSETLAFKICPMLNSAGRLDSSRPSIALLRAESLEQARHWAAELDRANKARRDLDRGLLASVRAQAEAYVAQGAHALTIWMPDGHAGVGGIVASRLLNALGRPVVCLSPKPGAEDVAAGSMRTINSFHARNALAAVHARTGALLGFGGHQGAAGLSIPVERIDELRQALEDVASEQLSQDDVQPCVLVDMEMPEDFGRQGLSEIAALEPYGRGFEAPVFTLTGARIERWKTMGDGTHLRLDVRTRAGRMVELVWFNARTIDQIHQDPIVPESADFAVAPKLNRFRGRKSLQLIVEAVCSGDNDAPSRTCKKPPKALQV